MKRLKLVPLFLTLIFFVSCSLGKRLLHPEKTSPAETAAGQNVKQKESGPQQGAAWENDAKSHLQAGIAKLQDHADEDAIMEFKKALILDPRSADAYYYLALAEQRMGHLDDAVEGYRAALKINPESYGAVFNLAVVYSLQRKYDLAMERYQEALNIFPDDPELHYNMALCYDLRGKASKAIPEYQKACQLDPRMVDAYLQLAALYERLNMDAEAKNEYQKVLKIAPDQETAKKNLAILTAEKEGEKVAQKADQEGSKAAKPSEPAAPEEGKPGIFRSSLAKLISYPKKLYNSIGGSSEESETVDTARADSRAKNFRLCLNNKLVTQKKVAFSNNAGDNTMTSKRSVVQVGYVPGFLNNTQVYLNLGSVSMGFDDNIDMGPAVKFEKAAAFAYGIGVSSSIYNLPQAPLGLTINMDFLSYSSKGEGNNSGNNVSATAEVTEYHLAADTVYQGFSKFSPYLGLLYAKSSGSLKLSNPDVTADFDEKNQFGCRLGTGYNWRENIKLTAEYRLLDESALSLLVNYTF
ncbi:MAG: tetratricopeptide repeat protein [bacterium]